MLRKFKDSVVSIFVDPFVRSPPLTSRLLLIISVSQSLAALSYNIIPFIFFSPTFYCTDSAGNIYPCQQNLACTQTPLKYKSQYTFDSIPLNFQLFCDRKKIEATMMTVMMIGHLVGAIVSSYLSEYGNSQYHLITILMVSNLICTLGLISFMFCQTPESVTIAFFCWNFGMDLINSFNNVIPVMFFPSNLAKKSMSIQVCSWPIYSILLPTLYGLIADWRIFCFFCIGIPQLIVTYTLWKDREALAAFNRSEVQDQQSEQKDQQHDDIPEIQSQLLDPNSDNTSVHSLNANKHYDLRYSDASMGSGSNPMILDSENIRFGQVLRSRYLKIILMYFIVYGGSYVASFASFVSLNTLSGNIYVNLTILSIIESSLVLAGGFLIHFFDVKKSLLKIYLLMGIGYCLYSVLPDFLKYIVVVQGKLLTDTTWVLLAVYTYMIVPQNFLPFMFSVRAIYNLLLYVILPYTRYYLQRMGLTVFLFAGVYEISVSIILNYMKQMKKG